MTLFQNGRERRCPKVERGRPALREVAVPAEALERYVGRYQPAPGLILRVRGKGEDLSAQLTGQPALPIFAASDKEFLLKVVDAQLSFEVNDSGPAIAVTLHQNGVDQRATHRVRP